MSRDYNRFCLCLSTVFKSVDRKTLEQKTKAAPASNTNHLATAKILSQTHSTIENDNGHGKEYVGNVHDERELESGRQL
jgi:hypothetical protein